MVDNSDVRWKQRFDNFLNALAQLEHAVNLAAQRPLSELERQGLIQAFEYTYELGWNVLRDYLEYQGIYDLIGSRDTFREAFRRNLIANGDAWMEMIKSRNLTSHAYSKKVAQNVLDLILTRHFSTFVELRKKMKSLMTS